MNTLKVIIMSLTVLLSLNSLAGYVNGYKKQWYLCKRLLQEQP